MAKKIHKTAIAFTAISIFLAAVIGGGAWLYVSRKTDDNTIVAQTDGMTIAAGELKMRMNALQAKVVEHFASGSEDTIDKNFWKKDYDGTTPEKYLKKAALDEIVRYKQLQKLGQKYKLVEDPSYAAFLSKMNNINVQNKQKKADGQPIYGQEQYNEQTFYEYTVSNLELELQKVMTEQGEPLYADENKLKQYYEQHKSSYKNPDEMKFDVYEISANLGGSDTGKKQLQNAHDIIVDKKGDYSSATRKIERICPLIISKETSINKDNASAMSKQKNEFYNLAISLKKGEVSNIVQDGDKMLFLYCTSKKSDGYQSFNSAKSTVLSQYSQSALEDYLDKAVKNADVTTNEKFDKITVDTID